MKHITPQNNHLLTSNFVDKMLRAYDTPLKKRVQGLYKNMLLSVRKKFEKGKKNHFKRQLSISILGLIYPNNFSEKKYIFVGLRYKDLIFVLPKNEVLIICCDKSDIIFSIKNKISFIPGTGISHHFLQAYFEKSYNNLKKDIRKIYGIFSNQKSPCYLIVTSDTRPLDIFFLELAKYFSKCFRLLYVQHGVISDVNSKKLNIVVEGQSVPFVILYATSQQKFAEKYIKSSKFLVMGVPWNIPVIREKGSREVVLIGAGGGDSYPTEYTSTIATFQMISKHLSLKGIQSVYRPHGTESFSFVNNIFEKIDTRKKEKLLSGTPKLFIGINSTLMFEAYLCGHTVFGINVGLFGTPTFSIDKLFSLQQIDELYQEIERTETVKKRLRKESQILTLKERFKKVIAEVEFLASNTTSLKVEK